MKHHVYINNNITSFRFIATNNEFLQRDNKGLDMKHYVYNNVNITSFRFIATNDEFLQRDNKI